MESSLYMHYMEVCANSGASVKRSELADANERKKGELQKEKAQRSDIPVPVRVPANL